MCARLHDALVREIIDGAYVAAVGASAAELGREFLATRRELRAGADDTSRWTLHVATAAWATRPLGSVTRRDGARWLDALKAKHTSYDAKTHGRRSRKLLSWQTRKHRLKLEGVSGRIRCRGDRQVAETRQNPDGALLRSSCASGRIRTCDLRLRRPSLYPAELRTRTN